MRPLLLAATVVGLQAQTVDFTRDVQPIFAKSFESFHGAKLQSGSLRLETEGVQPSPEAAKTTLLRRFSFDLTGLPRTIEETRVSLDDIRELGEAHSATDHHPNAFTMWMAGSGVKRGFRLTDVYGEMGHSLLA